VGYIKAIGIAIVGFVLFILGRKSIWSGNNRKSDEGRITEGIGRARAEVEREGQNIARTEPELERASRAVTDSLDINRDASRLVDRTKDLERLDALAYERLRKKLQEDPIDDSD